MLAQAQTRIHDRLVIAGLGAIFILHVVVLAIAPSINNAAAVVAPINYLVSSIVLQAISMLLPVVFAALTLLRSRDFARKFWILVASGRFNNLQDLLSHCCLK